LGYGYGALIFLQAVILLLLKLGDRIRHSKRQLDDDQKILLQEIRRATGCVEIATGWASTSESKRKLLTVHGLNFSDLPVLVYTQPLTHCTAFYKGKVELGMVSEFLKEVRGGKLCNRTFYAVSDDTAEGTEGAGDREGETRPKSPGTAIGGGWFILSFASIGFVIMHFARRLTLRREVQKNVLE
jgi:hypothetical protein